MDSGNLAPHVTLSWFKKETNSQQHTTCVEDTFAKKHNSESRQHVSIHLTCSSRCRTAFPHLLPCTTHCTPFTLWRHAIVRECVCVCVCLCVYSACVEREAARSKRAGLASRLWKAHALIWLHLISPSTQISITLFFLRLLSTSSSLLLF